MHCRVAVLALVFAFVIVRSACAQTVEFDYGAVRPVVLNGVVEIEGEPTGGLPSVAGTASIVHRKIEGPQPHDLYFLVTAKHLISDWDIGHTSNLLVRSAINCRFYSRNSKEQVTLRRIQLTDATGRALPARFYLHPQPEVDVALVNLTEESLGERVEFPTVFDESFFLPFSRVPGQLVGLGDQVFALGYPGGITSVSGRPIAKAGYLATTPGELLTLTVSGMDRWHRPVSVELTGAIYLVDGLLVHGNSGGPVVLRAGLPIRRNPQTQQLEFSTQEIPNFVIGIVSQSFDNTGLAIVYGSDYVIAAVDQFVDLLEMRK